MVINYCDCRNTMLRNNVKQCDTTQHNRTCIFGTELYKVTTKSDIAVHIHPCSAHAVVYI